MEADVIIRASNFGIALVDDLSGGPLLFDSDVAAVGSAIVPQQATQSRWFFEGLQAGATEFVVEADSYVSSRFTAVVPTSSEPGEFRLLRLLPAPGYPFSASLTRVVGAVRFLADGEPVHGATVTITPEHAVSGDGPTLVTGTIERGLYTMWFLPNSTADPMLPSSYRASAEVLVDGTTFSGSIPSQTLVGNVFNDAPPILLT